MAPSPCVKLNAALEEEGRGEMAALPGDVEMGDGGWWHLRVWRLYGNGEKSFQCTPPSPPPILGAAPTPSYRAVQLIAFFFISN